MSFKDFYENSIESIRKKNAEEQKKIVKENTELQKTEIGETHIIKKDEQKKTKNQIVTESINFPPDISVRLENQLKLEYKSAFIYFNLSSKMSTMGFSGLASYFNEKGTEELIHASKVMDFLKLCNVNFKIDSVSTEELVIESVYDAAEIALEHEMVVSRSINAIYNFANDINEVSTQTFLDWFVSEQVEEEKQALDLFNKVKIARDNTAALLSIDSEYSK
jgi:ferritin